VYNTSVNEIKGDLPYRVLTINSYDFFDKDNLGHGDASRENGLKVAFFSRAAILLPEHLSLRYDCIICFDWQTGLVPVFMRLEPYLEGIPVIFTAFNLSEQGLFTKYLIPEIGLSWELFNFRELEFWGQLSFIKGGLVFSDKIVLPNSSSLKVLQEEVLGFGLEDLLKTRQEEIRVILPCFDNEGEGFTEEDKVKARQRIILKSCYSDSTLPLILLPINKEPDMYNMLEGFFNEGLFSLECNWLFYVDRVYEGMSAPILSLASSMPNRIKLISEGFSYADCIKASDMMLFLAHIAGTGFDFYPAIRYGTWVIGSYSSGLEYLYADIGFSPAIRDAMHVPFVDYNRLFLSLSKSLKLFEDLDRDYITKALLSYNRSRIDIANEFLSLLD